MFIALYLPALPPNTKNPSVSGFQSEKCAWDFVYSQMCDGCKKERQLALKSKKLKYDEHPGCAYEWEVIDSKNLSNNEIKEIEEDLESIDLSNSYSNTHHSSFDI